MEEPTGWINLKPNLILPQIQVDQIVMLEK